jgi:hypothetical protein
MINAMMLWEMLRPSREAPKRELSQSEKARLDKMRVVVEQEGKGLATLLNELIDVAKE